MHSIEGNERLTLLHVDDSKNERLLVKQAVWLTQTAFEVYEADGLETAIACFLTCEHEQATPPSAILLDYDLGESTGAEFLHWLRNRKRITNIPVIMFTGSVGTPHIAQCYCNGADYFLRKPNSLARLKTIVQTIHLGLTSLQRPSPIMLLPEFMANPMDFTQNCTGATG